MRTYLVLLAIFGVLGGLQLVGLGWIPGAIAVAIVGAELAVLDIARSAIRVSFLSLPLDVPAMLAAAGETAMPHLDWWSSLWRTNS